MTETMICKHCKQKVRAYRPYGMAAKYATPHRVRGEACAGNYRRDDSEDVDLVETKEDKARREAASKQYNEDMRGDE